MNQRSSRNYQGDFVTWNGGCLLIGSGAGLVAPHSHYAIQLAIGAPAGLKVQFGLKGDWHDCPAALIPSRARHTIDVVDCGWSAVLFIEPETAEGRAGQQMQRMAIKGFAGQIHDVDATSRVRAVVF